MPIVLIVDDSEADKALIREYVQAEEIDWIVEFTDSAEQAIVRLKELAIDVLVTDMRMPGMSGFELIEHVRNEHPHIPVVLITEHDNDETASEALSRGAASYVAKQELETRLTEVIKQMVQVSGLSRGFDALFQRVEEMSFQINLENDPRIIPSLVNALDLMALRMGLCGLSDRQRIGVALDEAILNAMLHGNLEIPKDELVDVRVALRNGTVPDSITSRATEAPYTDRTTTISASFNSERLVVVVKDEGKGIASDVRNITSTSSENRGLVVIHHLMDSVSFNAAGNAITMTKYREATPNEEATIPV